jgi:hypothetical protein
MATIFEWPEDLLDQEVCRAAGESADKIGLRDAT